MANQSIYNAFERMWQHVVWKLADKSDKSHNHWTQFATNTTITLPDENKTYLLLVVHNSSANLNGIYIYIPATSNYFPLDKQYADWGFSMTCSGVSVTVNCSDADIKCYYTQLP